VAPEGGPLDVVGRAKRDH